MADIASLSAVARRGNGKGAARAVRRQGRVPGVVYGSDKDPVSVSLDGKELGVEYHRAGFFSRLYDLSIDGQAERVLPREVQIHPVTDVPLHIDFLRLTADSRVNVDVPVVFVNDEESPGLKRGGVLNVVRHTIELLCRADSIPEVIEFDLTGTEIGDSIHISAVTLPDGVNPAITDRDFTVATVASPTVVRDEAAEEAEAEDEELEGVEGEEAVEGAEGEPRAEGEAPADGGGEGES